MIRTDGLFRAFGGRQALAPLSTHFERGRVTVLLGPSGCGKSTLLRLLIGLLAPDAGSVEIDGVTLGTATVEAIRHRTGYVIQEGGLFPHLTARDNITLLARHLRWDGGRIAERRQRCGEHVLDHPVHQRAKQRLLAFEQGIERAAADPDPPGNVCHRRGRKAALRKGIARGIEDALKAIGRGDSRHGLIITDVSVI